jgi:UDP-glucose 4-epimerase
MKILVTGGAGFIGSNLCERLTKDGHEVWSLDNYFTGSKENEVEGAWYIRGETASIKNLKFEPEIIYHLGEYSRVEQSFEDHELVWDYNVLGTKQVLDYALDKGAKLIYAGSSTKFGDIGSNSSPYAWSKANNTQLVKNYHDWYGMKFAITYFYNVYGKREISTGKYATLIAKFLEKYKKGEPLTVTLPGTQKRNFTHVNDTVDALIKVGLYGEGDNYGIGSDESFSVDEIAKMFDCEIIYTPEKQGNRTCADVVSNKTKELGWQPTHSVRDYIGEAIKP